MLLQYLVSLVIVTIVVAEVSFVRELPTYIDKCSRRDRHINSCIEVKGNRAIPKVAKGDPHYDIPFMMPLFLNQPMVLRNDRELRLVLQNALIYGIENTQLTSVNFTGSYSHVIFINPAITILANYEMKGKILDTHIFGKGNANITLEKGVYEYEVYMPAIQRNGDYYFKMTKPRTAYETVQSHYVFDRLYNGDEYLGAQMNRYMNEHWRGVQRALKPAANLIITNIITTVLNGIANNVPIKDIFLP